MEESQEPKGLALKPWPNHAEEEPWSEILTRVHGQRGGFRLVTEDALEREIAEKGTAMTVDKTEEESEEEAATSRTEALEKLHASKREILTFAYSARQEVIMALNLVSLLLSKEHPKVAESSLSIETKRRAPLGSIGYDNWDPDHPAAVKPTPPPPQEEQLVARGARMQGLMFAADSLLQGASRLKNEVERETKYWKEVLAVKEKGWAIHRVPTGQNRRSGLGVEISSIDAGAQFRSQFAVFQRSEDGNVRLECNVKNQPMTLRVRLLRGGKVVGSSGQPRSSALGEEGLESQIQRMRDSLFEEELFFEMTQEVRSLLPFGAVLNDGCISLPNGPSSASENESKILIDLVPLDGQAPESGDLAEADQARAIAMFLRLMLMRAHIARYDLRTQVPGILQEKKRPPPTPALLQPLITHLRHVHAVKGVLKTLTTSRLLLGKAGIVTTVTLRNVLTALEPELPDLSGAKPVAAIVKLCNALAGLQETRYELSFPSEQGCANGTSAEASTRTYEIAIRSDVGKIEEGVEYVLALPDDRSPNEIASLRPPPRLRFQDAPECAAWLRDAISGEVAQRYLPRRDPEARVAGGSEAAAVKRVGEKAVKIVVRLDEVALRVAFAAKGQPWSVAEWTATGETKDLLDVVAEKCAKLAE